MPDAVLDVLAFKLVRTTLRIVARVNDYDVRIGKVKGSYVWHKHDETDEFYMVLEGELSIGIREDDGERFVHLGPHDVFVVPKGIEHRPTSLDGASVLLLEPAGTLSTGDYRGDIPSHIDSTIGHRA